MLYHLFPHLNPMLAILVIGPILAGLAAIAGKELRLHPIWPTIVSLFIPLLFIWKNLYTLQNNLDAWVIYGFAYAAITLLVYKFAKKGKVRG
ncbi:hypothetical protein [Saccharibacillus kuerlensis]|uniref:DUF2651 domain-containing protein n=1 Tax=Saccharibacillus kuerlensis TaxID=459527 RepID=A0ABQ2L0T5_9BACL|nr:hypothetical protein [Saccharibacillus kuerlensis]GGN98599.1 hypothetical protein GCM10010969_17870 [Saccharibacillus kuerlensis]